MTQQPAPQYTGAHAPPGRQRGSSARLAVWPHPTPCLAWLWGADRGQLPHWPPRLLSDCHPGCRSCKIKQVRSLFKAQRDSQNRYGGQVHLQPLPQLSLKILQQLGLYGNPTLRGLKFNFKQDYKALPSLCNEVNSATE